LELEVFARGMTADGAAATNRVKSSTKGFSRIASTYREAPPTIYRNNLAVRRPTMASPVAVLVAPAIPQDRRSSESRDRTEESAFQQAKATWLRTGYPARTILARRSAEDARI